MDCIFCKIVKGEIDSAKVFENEKVFAFLDITPLNKGHCLVIPKEHIEIIFDIDKDILREITSSAKNIAGIMRDVLGAKAVNLINASGKEAEQSVFHFHLHIVPRYENDGLEMNKWWQSKAKKISTEELKDIANKIRG